MKGSISGVGQPLAASEGFETSARKCHRRWPTRVRAGNQIRTAAVGALLLAVQACASVPGTGASCPAPPRDRAPVAATPLNIDLVKKQLISYHKDKTYEADIKSVYDVAEVYIDSRRDKVTRPAIVLDIDETVLSNWETFEANDFGFFADAARCDIPSKEACGFNVWTAQLKATALEPARDFFNRVKSKGVAIFFVTGRRDSQRAMTVTNLEGQGIYGWAELITRSDAEHGSPQPFKTKARETIQARYTIVANIGDQLSDLDGGRAAECAFKLPNPFYFIE